ncbi:lysozyme family protein [Acidocella facilis]|uniref:murein transglycosylase n=1 Tax=Acidocella facilis TaxID=525 RepID=UPI001F25BEB4|nr:murein transglycosylase [Acidocella facilis]
MTRWLLISAAFLAAAPAFAEVPDGASCAAAGRAVELADTLPTNLLLSIGLVESGRSDPLSGRSAPWPWTVNADGTGRYFANKQDAEAFVRLAQASGARDIDVGCFQVSLTYHPTAFASLDDAFDPAKNAAYAGLYLTQLKARTGSWNAAIADYHSALPDLGLPYQRLVLAAWKRVGDLPPDMGAAINAAAIEAPDPVAIIQTAAAKRIHVYSMNSPDNASWRPGLPRVIDDP